VCSGVCGEDFLFSGQERPSAAALARRAGPVLASLRAAGPAAAHSRKPGDPEKEVLTESPGLSCDLIEMGWLRPGLSSPPLIINGRPPPLKAAARPLAGQCHVVKRLPVLSRIYGGVVGA
jgi:hypothetical protein